MTFREPMRDHDGSAPERVWIRPGDEFYYVPSVPNADEYVRVDAAYELAARALMEEADRNDALAKTTQDVGDELARLAMATSYRRAATHLRSPQRGAR